MVWESIVYDFNLYFFSRYRLFLKHINFRRLWCSKVIFGEVIIKLLVKLLDVVCHTLLLILRKQRVANLDPRWLIVNEDCRSSFDLHRTCLCFLQKADYLILVEDMTSVIILKSTTRDFDIVHSTCVNTTSHVRILQMQILQV